MTKCVVRWAVVALAILPAVAQATDSKKRGEEPLETGLVERSGTTLMLLDVEVLDKQGNPIPGLTQKDFLVEIDGRLRPLVSVDDLCLVSAEPTLADVETTETSTDPTTAVAVTAYHAEPLGFVIYFDFSQLDSYGRSNAIEQSTRWVRDTKRPGDRVQVVAFASSRGHASRFQSSVTAGNRASPA